MSDDIELQQMVENTLNVNTENEVSTVDTSDTLKEDSAGETSVEEKPVEAVIDKNNQDDIKIPKPDLDEKATRDEIILKRRERRIEAEKQELENQRAQYLYEQKRELQRIAEAKIAYQNMPQIPERDNFATDADYYKAVNYYAKEQIKIEESFEKEKYQKEEALKVQSIKTREFIEKTEEVFDTGRSLYSDFEKVITPMMRENFLDNTGNIKNMHFIDAINESDQAEHIYYMLGSNKKLAKELSEKTAVQGIKFISKLETMIQDARNKPSSEKQPQKKVMENISSKGAVTKGYNPNMTQSEWEKYYTEKHMKKY